MKEKLKALSDKMFELATDHLLPEWLKGDSKFAKAVTDFLWVDCPYCLGMRFATIGGLLGFVLGAIVASLF